MLFDDLGDFVGFESVLECADFEIEIFGDAAEHEDLVLAVGVGVDKAISGEDLGEGNEFEVLAAFDCFHTSVCVFAGFGEAVAHDGFDAHAGLWVAGGFVVAPVGLFDILAEGELDAGFCVFKEHVLRFGGVPADLDGFGLAAHWVC